jgi:chitodextrinase
MCALLGAATAAAGRHDWQAPSVPTGLVATAATTTSVSLSWSASSDNVAVRGYSYSAVGIKGGTTSATSQTLTGLTCGTDYTFLVNAYDTAGNHSANASLVAATASCALPPAPANTSLPTIAGSAALGSPLTAWPGTWSGSPTSYTYQWQYCSADMVTCSDIIGFTSTLYTPVPDDVGGRDRVKVTATNASGSAVAYSAATAVVVAAPPANTTPPAVSGTTVSGSGLSASAGSWSGSPTSYAYQWRRCDSGGSNCGDISGASGSSYTLGSADVGETLRVKVTAANAGGSTATSSSQTAVVAAPATAPPTGADFFADPNLTGSLLPWDRFDPGNASSTNGILVANQPNGATSPGIVAVTNDPLGQQGKVYQETVTPTAQASVASGSDSTYLWNGTRSYFGNNGQSNWIHFRMMLPTGYQPTVGEWNFFNEYHNDTNYLKFYNAGQISWEYPELGLLVTNYSGDVPHLLYRVRGGQDCNSCNMSVGTDVRDASPLLLNHWYDVVLHVVWSPDPTVGQFEWWLDGRLVGSIHRGTLWQRPDGTYDHANFEFNNYRQHSSWNATVYYGKVSIGSTEASVGF